METDDTGSFRIAGLPEGRITLDAIRRGTSPPWVGLIEVDAGAVDVVLRLEPDPRHVVLKIVGPDGKPIPQALVRHTYTSAAEARGGRFEIESMHLDHWDLDVVVSDARDAEGTSLGLAPARVSLPKGRGGEVEVRLAPGYAIAGRVVDEQGAAIPGALLRAAAGAASRGDDEEQGPATRTSEDGTFRIAPLGDGPHILTVAPPEPFVAIAPQSVVAGTEDLRLVVRRGVSALVTVLDGDGRPVRGAGVYVQGVDAQNEEGIAVDDAFDQMFEFLRNAPGGEEPRTDAMGTVRLPPLDPAQRFRVRVVGPREGVDLAAAALNDWRPEATTVRLARSWTVSGVVQDEQGLPIPRAHVHARTESTAQRFATADDDGRFEVRQLEAGTVLLTARAGEGASVPGGPEVRAKAGDQGVVLVAPAGQMLLVTVEGLPARECELEAFLELEQRSPQDWDPVVWGRAVDARTVRFRHLEPTKAYTLWIRPCEGAPDLSAWVTGVRGSERELRVRLQPGRTVRGSLLGLPAGVDNFILLAVRGSLTLDAAVQEDGRFEIRGLPEGSWTLRAHAWTARGEVYTGEAEVAAGGTVEIPMKSSSDEPAGR